MATKTVLQNSLRKRYMDMVTEFLTNQDEEVLQVASNEIALPCVDDEGNDEFIVLTFKIPKGTRDGDAYDGYEMAEDFKLKSELKAEKQKKAQAEKSAKMARDKALREKKAKAKAEREKTEVVEQTMKMDSIGGQMVRKLIEQYEKAERESGK